MQTDFSPAQLSDPQMRDRDESCAPACIAASAPPPARPMSLLGDELDSPRGRIYLIKDMLEGGKPATPEVVKHIDRCLSCLSCMTTCPSGVHYMHLVDHARAYIEDDLSPALAASAWCAASSRRCCRTAGCSAWPWSWRGSAGAPCRWCGALPQGERLAAMLATWRPQRCPPPATLRCAPAASRPRASAADGWRCSAAAPSRCSAPGINEAAIRLLNRHGVEVVLPSGEGCCGALVHHMGRSTEALEQARAQRRCLDGRDRARRGWTPSWSPPPAAAPRSRTTASCCARTPPMPPRPPASPPWPRTSPEYLATLSLRPARALDQTVAYHSACSMQHGQKIVAEPKTLLKRRRASR